ncbi:MAG: TetR/AcrR family transcriptional regulator [Bacteroidota bacterium]
MVNKKSDILEAALQLLAVNGVHATPMSAIAKAGHTGMGTIYNLFATKEILINAIYVEIKRREEVLLLVPHRKRTIKSQFEHFYLLITNFYLKNPACYKFMNQLHASPIITDESRQEGRRAVRPVIEVIEAGQKEGILKNIDQEELLLFIAGAISSHLDSLINPDLKVVKKPSFKNQLRLVWDAIKK